MSEKYKIYCEYCGLLYKGQLHKPDCPNRLGQMLAAIDKPKFNKRINGSRERTTEKTLPSGINKEVQNIVKTTQ